MVTKVFASIMPRFLAVSCLVATLALLPASQALATQASTSGFVDDSASDDETIELFFNLDRSKQLILYGLGPSATDNLGRSDVLVDPFITLYRLADDGSYVRIDSNNDWQDHPSADQTRQALEDFGASLDPKESAMVLELSVGSYRLDLTSAVRDATGWAIVGGAEYRDGTPPGDGDIQGGAWRGQTSTYDVCFNVASDGSRLTPNGSPCGDGGEAFDVNIREGGFSGSDCEDEDADVDYDETDVLIVDNRFQQEIDFDFATYELDGTFADGVLNGTISFSFDIFGITRSCTATFSATPAQ
jgi:hypothetical protein